MMIQVTGIKSILSYSLIYAVCLISCKQRHTTSSDSFSLSPESGTIVKSGEVVDLKLLGKGAPIDSVQYFLDTTKLAVKTDSSVFQLHAEGCALGTRLVKAKIFRGGQTEEITTNIVIVSSKTPEQFRFQVVNTFKHDTSSYTQGLEYHDGIFYESDGEYAQSSLRKVAVDGKVLKQKDLEAKYFAEGITVVGDKILMLTYKERVMMVFDKNTFELLQTLPYNHAVEGWGLAFDGQTIYNTDGTNRIFKLNKDTFQPEGFIEVYDDKGPVEYLNEMEWIDGKIYANIYTSDLIAVINPHTGEVEAYLNLMGLRKDGVEDESQDVLNGIAWDAKGKRLFVTGKKWPKLFEIKMLKK